MDGEIKNVSFQPVVLCEGRCISVLRISDLYIIQLFGAKCVNAGTMKLIT